MGGHGLTCGRRESGRFAPERYSFNARDETGESGVKPSNRECNRPLSIRKEEKKKESTGRRKRAKQVIASILPIFSYYVLSKDRKKKKKSDFGNSLGS